MNLLLRERGAILLLIVNLFLIFTGIGLVIPVMPTYMTELGIGGSVVGLLVAAFSLTQFLFSPYAGKLSDSIGRKKIVIAGMLVFALSEWMFGAAHSVVLLFAARFLGGIGAALIMPAVMAYVADVTTNEERAKGMGFVNAAITTGFIIGPGIGGYLAAFGIRVPFYAAAVAGLVAAAVTALLLAEPSRAPQPAVREPVTERGQDSLLKQLRLSYREPFFPALLLVFVLTFGLANYETLFGLFVDHKFGFTPKDIAFVITFGSIAGAVVQATVFGSILNRFGEQRVISLCLLAGGVFVLLSLLVGGFWSIFAVTLFLFLSIDILRPAIGVQMSRMGEDRQGYVAGLNSAFTSLGNIVGPIAGGVLFDVNVNAPYSLAAVVLLAGYAMTVFAGKERRSSRYEGVR
ncbi:MAG: MFS transporter [Paenibacillaceae bacterium]|nr:MFS transporter [Paenibacillaceae bacterium]